MNEIILIIFIMVFGGLISYLAIRYWIDQIINEWDEFVEIWDEVD